MSAHFSIREWGSVTLVTPITPQSTEWVAEHMPDLHHIGDAIPFGHEGAAMFITTVLNDIGGSVPDA